MKNTFSQNFIKWLFLSFSKSVPIQGMPFASGTLSAYILVTRLSPWRKKKNQPKEIFWTELVFFYHSV